ncbi:hypothetical protein GGR57DRAFT_461743 [Xylariaceae sp. FL1272]|nr:hypothetical protein GGR57DRAFT_461743 [Xylariaceae sp. FL1272]
MFDTYFQYTVHAYNIPSVDPEKSLNTYVANFIRFFGGEERLIIVYYGGHGGPKGAKDASCEWAARISEGPTVAMKVEGDDGRAYVVKYSNSASFPLEVGDTVWVTKPGNRAPMGEFVIVKSHPQDTFELAVKSTGVAHSELVERKHILQAP